MDYEPKIVHYLKVFFSDKDKLKKSISEPRLIRVAEYIKKYESVGDKEFKTDIQLILQIYRDVYNLLGDDILKILIRQDREIVNYNNIWDTKRNQVKKLKDTSDKFESFETSMHLIGDLIEGIIKSHFKEIYQLVYFKEKKEMIKESKIEQAKLGDVNDFLLNHCDSNLKNLFQTLYPIEYKLSNWRNLVQHKNYVIIDQNIELNFVTKSTHTTHLLSFEETLNYYSQINRTANILQLVRNIFLFDINNEKNVIDETEYKKVINTIPTVKQTLLIKDLETVLLSINLELKSYDKGEDTILIYVQDQKEVSEHYFNNNIIYLSSLLYNVWEIFKTDNTIIKYSDVNSLPICTIKTDSAVCEQVQTTNNINILAEKFNVYFHARPD